MGEWTIDQVKNLLSGEKRRYHEAKFSEDRRNIFYKKVAEIQNLIEMQHWRLNPPKLNKQSCTFFLRNRNVRPFGILLHTRLPHAQQLVDRTGNRISDFSIRSNLSRIFVKITNEDAEHLEREHDCNFCAVSLRLTYYDIPENVSELLPVLEFAYKNLEFAYNKHREM